MQREDVYKEPMYDDVTLELIEEQKTTDLIEAVLQYTRNLEKMVIELRKEVNNLIPKGKPKPYADLHSDIYQLFYHYPAYPKYEEIFKILD